MCTNVPGLGGGKCDSGKVPKVTCSDGLDQCLSLKGIMTVSNFTQSIELKNCSNNVLCNSASDYNGTNSNEFSSPLLSSPHPPPLPPTNWFGNLVSCISTTMPRLVSVQYIGVTVRQGQAYRCLFEKMNQVVVTATTNKFKSAFLHA